MRTRTVSYTDSQGNRQTRTETYRVNTHFDSFLVPYHSVRDVSGPFILNLERANIMQKDLIKLKLELEITWADAISISDYQQYKNSFIEKNKYKDVYMDFSEERSLSGFTEYNLVNINENNSCFINRFWYVLSIIFTFTQFYKWYLDSKCIHQKFKIIKLLSTRYNLIQQEGYSKMQPRLDLITKQYDFDLSRTAYCDDKAIQLPSLEEANKAMNQFGEKLPNLVIVNENGRESVKNLCEENYDKSIEIKKEIEEDKKSEDSKINIKNSDSLNDI